MFRRAVHRSCQIPAYWWGLTGGDGCGFWGGCGWCGSPRAVRVRAKRSNPHRTPLTEEDGQGVGQKLPGAGLRFAALACPAPGRGLGASPQRGAGAAPCWGSGGKAHRSMETALIVVCGAVLSSALRHRGSTGCHCRGEICRGHGRAKELGAVDALFRVTARVDGLGHGGAVSALPQRENVTAVFLSVR